MATWNQKNASKINGARSKGPVTPEGKAKVSQNGCKHGLSAKQTVLRNEDPAQYAELREVYLRDYAPASEMETDLVLDIAEARWRLRRFRALETAALDFEMERMRTEIDATLDIIDEESRTMLAFNSLISLNRTFEVLQTSIRAPGANRIASKINGPNPAPRPTRAPPRQANAATKPCASAPETTHGKQAHSTRIPSPGRGTQNSSPGGVCPVRGPLAHL
ncbi:MAG: hypothetical protein SGI92_29520 [Bryobacteraceae bacterium]|nr:hypothetical protein [Bryobacteraceae bacterium]